MRVPDEQSLADVSRDRRQAGATMCTTWAITHVEFMPITEHPFDGSWGYQTVGLLCADQPLRHAAGFHVSGGLPAPARHRRDPRLGARRISRPTPMASITSTARISTSTPTRARAFIRTGTRLIFNYGRAEVRNFLVSNALFWLDKYHLDGLRVDAVASMLYLDYGRAEGRMDSQSPWRQGKPGGHRVSAAASIAQPMRDYPGTHDHRRGIHGLADGFPAHLRRRPGIRLEVGYGLDARHAGVYVRPTRCTANIITTS